MATIGDGYSSLARFKADPFFAMRVGLRLLGFALRGFLLLKFIVTSNGESQVRSSLHSNWLLLRQSSDSSMK